MDDLRTFKVIGVRKLKHSNIRLTLKDVESGIKISVVRQFPWYPSDPKMLIGHEIHNCKIETIYFPVMVLTRLTKDNETGKLYYTRGWDPNTLCARFLHDALI